MNELNEEAGMADVLDRLAGRFPWVPRERIEVVVGEEGDRLAGAGIHDFILVLIESEAITRLRTDAVPAPLPPVDEATARTAATVPSDEPAELDPLEVERRSERTGVLLGDLGGGPH